jgi:hypothetical protein
MGGVRTTALRIESAAALTAALAVTLGGCGYRELKAPCGPEEGTPPALSYAPPLVVPTPGTPLDRLSVYGGMGGGGGGIPVTDPCGPLRRVNSSLATAVGRSPADDPP